MQTTNANERISSDRVMEIVRQYWGFDQLRPLQAEAIRAGLAQHDSLVVLPTGGGKSLCYQVPPLVANRTDIVVSPLISLMKDQVDSLKMIGFPAAAVHSGMPREEQDEALCGLTNGKLRLVFVSPERAITPGFQRAIDQANIRTFSIDEAHCISQWGHDFRPDYRRLCFLKERLTGASVHAYTATATQRVRQDIMEQLRLQDPTVLVGDFDRPNLTYRILPRVDLDAQVIDAVRRHEGEAVIVYCLSRKDTESLAEKLRAAKIHALPYHAGMSPAARLKTQDAFADESLNVVTATIAFGMGIDRSNVRCVIHATMPRSVEHYQQETGRAGRDGLEAECVLFYSAADSQRWESLIEKSMVEAEVPADMMEAQFQLLQQIKRFCTAATCRHRSLVMYFGQSYERKNCGACDFCLKEVEGIEDATVIAQKILSCVARVNESFGANYVVDVLLGADIEAIRNRRHDQLSTFGLLKETARKTIMSWVFQLVDQGVLVRTSGELPILKLNKESWEVLRSQRTVRLLRPKTRLKKTKVEEKAWAGVDTELFERLRSVRRELALERSVPAFVILSDAALRELARKKPSTMDHLLSVYGIGQSKASKFGERFLQEIADHSSI